jgi:hypothetical protein
MPIFAYGDYMLPTAVYAETCIRSKASQYAHWTTLASLVEHMTPATLYGYKRYPSDASEGLESVPTIIKTDSSTDVVHGMLILGMHPSHTIDMRKYEWKHERDVCELVEVELHNGEKIEVEAKLRPYDGEWQPKHLVEGE